MIKHIFLLLLMGTLLVSCGGKARKEQKESAEQFAKILSAQNGDTYVVSKSSTKIGKYSVFKNMRTGEYVAYNLQNFNKDTMKTYTDYSAVLKNGDIVTNLASSKEYISDGYSKTIYDTITDYDYVYDTFCDCMIQELSTREVVVDVVWVDTSYWATYYTGGGFKFDATSTNSKDLEMLAGLEEENAQKFISATFKSEFSLTADRADQLARTAIQYSSLKNSRELTVEEKDIFALKALGVNLSSIESALKDKAEGSDLAYDDFLLEAAKVNNTTPEQIGKFFDKYVVEQL